VYCLLKSYSQHLWQQQSRRDVFHNERKKILLLSTIYQERLYALAMLSAEKNLLESSSNFNVKVIEASVFVRTGELTSLTTRLQVWFFSCCKFTWYLYICTVMCCKTIQNFPTMQHYHCPNSRAARGLPTSLSALAVSPVILMFWRLQRRLKRSNKPRLAVKLNRVELSPNTVEATIRHAAWSKSLWKRPKQNNLGYCNLSYFCDRIFISFQIWHIYIYKGDDLYRT
jgi:hypothetical protein